MSECTHCGAPTKYVGGLCTNCYYDKNESKKLAESYKNIEGFEGLSNKEHEFRYGMIKARIAETLIQELFLSLGYKVFRYGMENTIPGIMEHLTGIRSDVAQHIRTMPDFVIQNSTSKDVYFMEVKFRATGQYSLKNLPSDYPYTNAYIIVVSKKHIKCLTVAELRAGKEITPTSHNYLGNRKEFDLNKEVIIDFCNFAVQFFENV